MSERPAKMRKVISSSEHLSGEIFGSTPEDLIFEIFARLPLNFAARCKLVSKNWNSYISHPSLGKHHYEIATSRTTYDGGNTLVVRRYDYENEIDDDISILDFHSRSVVRGFEFPSKPRLFIVGCDAGIICLHFTLDDASMIYMWNPLFRSFKPIPSFNIPCADDTRVVLGFGYDGVAQDFKLVRVVPPSFSVELYSAKRDAWQNIRSKPSQIPIDRNFDGNFDVSVNGFLFTAGTYGMITFDLNTHIFDCINFPAPIFDPSVAQFNTFHIPVRISEFHDSIAAIICQRPEFIRKVELWVLNDESCLRDGGVEPSWTLMFNVDGYGDMQFVYGHLNTGDFLQLVADQWYLYNPENHEADLCDRGNENARIFADVFDTTQIFRYRKSIISIV